jgi:hypothetical protein
MPALLLAVPLLARLAGCTGLPMEDRANAEVAPEAEAWLSEQLQAVGDDAIALLSAPAPARTQGDELGARVTAELDAPAEVTSATFSCFGQGSMRLRTEAQTASSTSTIDHEPSSCSHSPHEVDPDFFGSGPLEEIAATGYFNARDSAWVLTLG